MTNGYNFNALTNTLTISESFAKKASKIDSAEYRLVLKLRKDHPDLKILNAEKKEGKKGLTFKQMEKFIGMHRNADELMTAFERTKKLAGFKPMPYKYVKNWFDKTFPYYYNDQYTLDEMIERARNLLNDSELSVEQKSEYGIEYDDD